MTGSLQYSFDTEGYLRSIAENALAAHVELSDVIAKLRAHDIETGTIIAAKQRRTLAKWRGGLETVLEHVGKKDVREACAAISREGMFEGYDPDENLNKKLADALDWRDEDLQELLAFLGYEKRDDMGVYASSDERGHGRDANSDQY